MRRGGLGRGLGALIPNGPPVSASASPTGAVALAGAHFRELPIEAVQRNPRQPRTVFDDDLLDELAASMREVGVLQPIVVRPADGARFELVMGERRLRAAQRAGMSTVPAIVRETPDDELLRDALLENLHREQLNPLDEAAAYAQLVEDFGATHEQVAARVGRSRAHVTNTLRLLGLPPSVQRRLAAGVLSAGHARALLSLRDPDQQEALATRIVAEGISVRGAEEAVALAERDPDRGRGRPRAPRRPPELLGVAGALGERLETRVRVEVGRSKGRIVVEFGSMDDLDRILGVIAPGLAVDVDGVEARADAPPSHDAPA